MFLLEGLVCCFEYRQGVSTVTSSRARNRSYDRMQYGLHCFDGQMDEGSKGQSFNYIKKRKRRC